MLHLWTPALYPDDIMLLVQQARSFVWPHPVFADSDFKVVIVFIRKVMTVIVCKLHWPKERKYVF